MSATMKTVMDQMRRLAIQEGSPKYPNRGRKLGPKKRVLIPGKVLEAQARAKYGLP